MLRSFVAVACVACVAPLASAQDDHPYKNAKVGDYATYTSSTQGTKISSKTTITQTILSKDEKEAVVKVAATVEYGGVTKELPTQEQTIDLTMPFDPTRLKRASTAIAKLDKVKDGKERITVSGKAYDCTWTTYKSLVTIQGKDFESEVKVWVAKGVPLGMVKLVTSNNAGGTKNESTLELKGFGSKK